MTYNIYHKFPSNRNADDVLRLIEMQDTDIFGCNEANTEWMSRLTAKFSGKYTCVKGKNSNAGDTGDFCPIFFKTDRFELLESGTKWLSDTPDKASKYAESHTNRIFTYAVLRDKASGVSFIFVQVHFENNETGYNSAAARKKQSEVLKEYVDNYFHLPVIISGDCNTTSLNDLSPLLSNSRFVNSSTIAASKKESGTWVGSSFSEITGGVLDYIFVSKDCISVTKYEALDIKFNGKYPSDHIPVRIDATISQ
jgi:endonuclease/exonuclease/phosphatase family metal-dependent hydrolase